MLGDAKTLLSSKKTPPSRFYDTFFISEYGKIESLRAARYNNCFSIVLMNIDSGERRLSDDEIQEILKKLGNPVLEAVRPCDVVGMVDDRQVVAILPETDYFGSLIAIRKLNKSVNGFLARENPALSAVYAQATFPKDGKGYGALLSTAAKRVAEKKESIWEKQAFRNKLFWEIVGDLSTASFKGFDNAIFDAGGGYVLGEPYIDQINELVVKEITMAPFKRGILYMSAKNVTSNLPILNTLGHIGTLATKVFLISHGEEGLSDLKNVSPIFLDDPRLKELFFTFYLTEDGGYALVCKENWGSTFSCFHSSDPCLVDGIINKFQIEYALQEQL